MIAFPQNVESEMKNKSTVHGMLIKRLQNRIKHWSILTCVLE